MPLISFVTPCYNEEANVCEHFERVCNAIAPFRDRYEFEHIYTDNCSQDRTFELLQELAGQHANVKVLRFSRNIGAGRAIGFGLQQATGDAAILIQADLQDPPELIPDLIIGWEQGNDVVYGQILTRDEATVLSVLRRLYYKIIAVLSDVPPPVNAGEFRLTSRRVLDAIAQYREEDLYLRGAVAHIGFRQLPIPYRRAARKGGRSSIGLMGLVSYALNGLSSTTVVPIRAVILVGLAVSSMGFLGTAGIVAAKVALPGAAPQGFTTLAALLTFFLGVELLAIGIIGEYVRKIYVQSLGRPRGFIQDAINIDRRNGGPESRS